jgi:hypothetical protein
VSPADRCATRKTERPPKRKTNRVAWYRDHEISRRPVFLKCQAAKADLERYQTRLFWRRLSRLSSGSQAFLKMPPIAPTER